MASNSSSDGLAINWGPWSRLPNGQWHREGQDLLGNWYEDNRDDAPVERTYPRFQDNSSLEECSEGFASMSINPQANYDQHLYYSQDLGYGNYDQATGGLHMQEFLPIDSHPRSGEQESRPHKGKGKHTERPEHSASRHHARAKGKSSKWSKGDDEGHDNSTRSSRTEAKGYGWNEEQQTTPGPSRSQDERTNDIFQSSLTHMAGRRLASIDEGSQEPSVYGDTHNIASREEGTQGELDSRPDARTISNNLTDGTSSDIKATEVDVNRSQSLVSSICVTEVFFNTSAMVSHLAISSKELVIQLLVANVKTVVQKTLQSCDAVTREHTPASSNHTGGNPTSPRTENEDTQPNLSERQHAPPKKRKKIGENDGGEDSDDEEQARREVPKSKQNEIRLFACPYVKHNKSLYGLKSYCNGHGWPNVSRIKEHLYRRHRQATHCARCHTNFNEIDALNAHLREQLPCERSEGTIPEGFNEAQEKKLRSRQGVSKLDQHGKWEKVYRILFPHENQIPSPYYDPDDFCLLTYLREGYAPLLASKFLEKVKSSRGEYNESQLVSYVTEAFDEVLHDSLRNAHKRQRVGASSEVASRTLLRQSNLQVETSSSTFTADAPELPTNTLATQPVSNPVGFDMDDMAGFDFQLGMGISFQPGFFDGSDFVLDSMQDREHDYSTSVELGRSDNPAQ